MKEGSIPYLHVELLLEATPHGKRSRYIFGCRCLPCRAANASYEAERARARAAGEGNGLVDATAARRHLLQLSRAGVGSRAVRDATGMPRSSIRKITRGDKTRIRRSTERSILAIDSGARSGASLVPAGETWQRLSCLLRNGFTRRELARRLGSKARHPSLQINRRRVTAETAMRVERFYNRIMH